MLTKELQTTLLLAMNEAKIRRHEYITLEHILWAMIKDSLAKSMLSQLGADLKQIEQGLEEYFESHIQPLSKDEEASSKDIEPLQTPALQRVLQRALIHAQSSGRQTINSANLLIAFYKESHSFSVYLLEKQGIYRLDLMSYVSHGLDEEQESASDRFSKTKKEEEQDGEEPAQKPNLLEQYTTNLCDKAQKNELDPLIGRTHELERTIQILCRRRKNNPLFVGDPGVGKTCIVEGLAQLIVADKVPESLKGSVIYSLDMGSLLAGTKFRGEFEARLKGILALIKKQPNAILFIDEIHTIYGAGSTSGGSLDASNMLKPALASGALRCIGSTTYNEYKAVFDKDRALARRFQKIEVNEPSLEEAYLILKGLKKHYESFHHVRYSDDALRAAVHLSAQYINERTLPDKAIDVIDEVGARVQLSMTSASKKKQKLIKTQDIEQVIAKIARIPEKNVSASDKEKLLQLEHDLKRLIYGQDQAVTALVSAIKLSRSGLATAHKPVGSFLFSGPTGVGKTELAKQLAHCMGIEFLRFDMSEYMEKHTVSRLIGAPPGYVGFDQGGLLTDAIRKTPHAVLVLDEIEKAHPDVYNLLLQVMDHATLTDNNGRKADFRHVVLIMTTNAGARDLSRESLGFASFGALSSPVESKGIESNDKKAIEKVFSPEFRNRLDAWIGFNPLSMTSIERVAGKFIAELEHALESKNVTLEVSANARTWLCKHGYDKQYGARPMARLIQDKIKKPLAEVILFGELEHGGRVLVDIKDDNICLQTNAF